MYLPWHPFRPIRRPQPAPVPDPTSGDDLAQLLAAHNRDRSGLVPLKIDLKLTAMAAAHASWMAANRTMTHSGGDGSFQTRLRASGYAYRGAGENVAAGYPTPAAVNSGWMNSPEHRANIMNGTFRDVGFGVVTGKDGNRYWSAAFGAPASTSVGAGDHYWSASSAPAPTSAGDDEPQLHTPGPLQPA